jgi:hypothetical protein
MSITPRKTRSTRAKIALVPALSLGLLGGSVAMAAPAQANSDHGSIRGCTVTPEKPSDEKGNWVNFRIKVHCDDGKKVVHIKQKRYEKDDGRDTKLNDHGWDYDYIEHRAGHHDYINIFDEVSRKLDRHGAEEVYHVISFAVENHNGKLSHWSEWKKSETLKDVNAHH